MKMSIKTHSKEKKENCKNLIRSRKDAELELLDKNIQQDYENSIIKCITLIVGLTICITAARLANMSSFTICMLMLEILLLAAGIKEFYNIFKVILPTQKAVMDEMDRRDI